MLSLPTFPMQFVLGSGLGDMIAHTTALQWTIENHPHIQGKVIAPKFFTSLARLWFKRYEPRFAVRNEIIRGLGMISPPHTQPNANGFHMIEVGFMYYVNRQVPDGWFKYPEIEGNEVDLARFQIPRKYVVITPGATAENKELPYQTQNAIIDWTLSKGWTPVVLGKKMIEIAYQAKFNENIHYDKCLDLRDKTDVLEAACVLANAQVVTGLDSGLTNLAACSRVPIILGQTISKLQVPPRRDGAPLIIIEPPLDLACRYCSHQIRFVKGDNTTRCYTNTFDCTKSMTPDRYVEALDALNLK